MSFETFLVLSATLLGAFWTPGPNNAMLAASGAAYGMRATTPHAIGVALGFGLMLLVVALGLGGAAAALPWLERAMLAVGAVLLLYIAWRIATAPPPGAPRRGRPFTALEAAAFQWINPKAWVIVVAISGHYLAEDRGVGPALALAGLACALGLTSTFGWAAFGAGLQRVLRTPWRARAFNLAMAGLVAAGALALAAELL